VYVLLSSMIPLDFSMEPSFEGADNDFGDVAFIRVTGLISSRDAVEEYLAHGMLPFLLASASQRLRMGRHWYPTWSLGWKM
jgi:hypothetical protein